jgi:phospholipid/cholesterol/gamma-HCH transport system substrate-binding protein
MTTTLNIGKSHPPRVSRTALMAAVLAAVLTTTAGVAGVWLHDKLTSNTVVAYFREALALYPGDEVQIMGVPVGSIDKIESAGDTMKITFHYANKYPVPATAGASILNPSLVASRTIQLSPPYDGGPVLRDGAVIPVERTQIPVEWDDVRNSISRILPGLGPTPQQPKGPLGDLIESAADGFAGKGQQFNETLRGLSAAANALNEGRGDFFSIVDSLAVFVNALHRSDQQFIALNGDLAAITDKFTHTDNEVADTLRDLTGLLASTRKFVDTNGEALVHNVDNLAQITTAALQPGPREGLETALHVLPHFAQGFLSFYDPVSAGVAGVVSLPNFANPLEFICSSIQAGSRLGYQESAELCAQYLAPVLDAIKFNYLPFGLTPITAATVLPKQVAYSETRLQPPPGYKDTTVPGLWSRDTPLSHGNHEPGWAVAPGMQGTHVQPATANLLTPDSLAELLGGQNIEPPPAGVTMTGPPNAYNETTPLPPPWYPQPGPPAAPAPGVIPGDPQTATANAPDAAPAPPPATGMFAADSARSPGAGP